MSQEELFEFEYDEPILPGLRRMRLELDQRMWRALRLSHAASPPSFNDEPILPEIVDEELLAALISLNPTIGQHLLGDGIDSNSLNAEMSRTHQFMIETRVGQRLAKQRGRSRSVVRRIQGRRPRKASLKKYSPSLILRRIVNKAIASRRTHHTIGTNDYLLSWLDDAAEHGDTFTERSHALDLLALCHGRARGTPVSQIPELMGALARLRVLSQGEDDFQYVVAAEGNRLVFRVVSVLGDYVQRSLDGQIRPQRALLSHFKDSFGGFTHYEVEELEALINDPSARETQSQRFFERHPHFLRKWDYREVFPQVVLAHTEGGLIPDFILTDRDLQRAAIVELKRPDPVLIRRQHNRDRFAAAVIEAHTQLLRYHDWFRDRSNRLKLRDIVGLEIYEPRLAVIIGRSSAFQDAFDRQRLQADYPDIEVVTYDDMLNYANRRRLIVDGKLFKV